METRPPSRQKARLARLSADQVSATEDWPVRPVPQADDHARQQCCMGEIEGDDGQCVVCRASRTSKIYAESLRGPQHLVGCSRPPAEVVDQVIGELADLGL